MLVLRQAGATPNYNHNDLWLWVPAFAGTTEVIRLDSGYLFHAPTSWPISAFSGSRIADGVREKRGAGAGWVTP